MKTKIRKGIFETNSSSTHSIVIGNNNEDIKSMLPSEIHFGSGEFGWAVDSYTDTQNKANYLWTGIVNNSMVDEYCPKIEETLNKYGIECTFEETEKKKNSYDGKLYDQFVNNKWGYIDHSGDLIDFIEIVCNDEILLLNYLFSNESCVATGNDNDDKIGDITNPKNILLEYDKNN